MNYRSLLIAAVQTTALYLSGFVIPLIGQVLFLFTPLPLILILLRNGRTEGLAALVVSCAFIALLGEWQLGVFLLLSFGLMAVGISEGMRKQMRPESTAFLGGLLPLIALGIGLAFFFVHTGRNPVAIAEEYLRRSTAEAAAVYTRLGFTEMAAAVTSITDTVVYYLARLLPGIIIATSAAQAAICYGIARSMLIRKPGSAVLAAQGPLALWHAPDMWVWGFIASLALLMIPDRTITLFGWNLVILYGTLYLAQGIALVDYFLNKMQIRPIPRLLVQAVILALPSIIFVAALGIMDIWADFRKVRKPVQTP